MNSEKDELLNILELWQKDLVAFIKDVFNVEPTEQQKEILKALQGPSAKVVVKAGRGVGKTAVAAWSIIWHVLLFEDSKTAVTSPTAAQLKDVLMSEVGKWLTRAPKFIQDQLVLTSNRLSLKDSENTQFMSARTADPTKPDSLQGFHAEHMYFCVDECFGVADSIFETARAGLTGEHSRVLLIGNPTNSNCFAAKACNMDGWQAFTLSCLSSPLVNQKYIKELEEEYGKDTDLYKVHVLGEFPSAAICQLIPNDLVDKAIGKKIKEEEYKFAPIIIGVDVAYFGDDRSVIFMRQGLASSLLHEYKAIDTMTLAGIVAQCEDQYKADAVFVDVTGVGAGVVDRLKQLGRNPLAVWFGGKPIKEKYKNKRAECWGDMKDWLELGGVLPLNVKGLKEDMTAPEYFFTPDGKIQLERKEDMKKRGRRSPDIADALAITFAQPVYKAEGARAYLSEPDRCKTDYDLF